MTTHNTIHDERDHDGIRAAPDQPDDYAAVLARIAGDYFPEFAQPEAEPIAELPPQLADAATLPLWEDEVAATVRGRDNGPVHIPHFPDYGAAADEQPGAGNAKASSAAFSFLDEARPIFENPQGSPFSFSEDNLPAGLQSLQSLQYGFSPLDAGAAQAASTGAGTWAGVFDVHAVRSDFPILAERVNGRPLIWLDNAATTQKPTAVLQRLKYFYEHENSNVHRGAHTLAARATDAYEDARGKIARFLNASSSREIVFVRGATEAINLVAQSWGRQHVQRDDEIIISWLEHHANIVPWQLLCQETGARLRVIPVDESGQVLFEEYQRLFTPKTKLVAVSHVSNALGTIAPVQAMVDIARSRGAATLVDGAQAVSHLRVDVQALGCDFYVFSGHKIFGPTGIGALYGRPELLESMPPYQAGGNMIEDVTFEKTVYQDIPARFEAGTGNIADAVGLGAAVDYVSRLGLENIFRYEHELLEHATEGLLSVPGLRLIGTAREKTSVLSFVIDGFNTEEIGKALSAEGIAVRAGHHCAQPILRRFGLESTVRPSLAFYNTYGEIDTLVSVLRNLRSYRL